jgi:hypothetical protein
VTQKDSGLKLDLFAGLGSPGPPNHARASPVTLQNIQILRVEKFSTAPPQFASGYESPCEEVPDFVRTVFLEAWLLDAHIMTALARAEG